MTPQQFINQSEEYNKEREERSNMGGNDGPMWKPTYDEHDVKLVLNGHDPTMFSIFSMWMHFGLQREPILCPRRNFGQDCPACDRGFDVLKSYEEVRNEFGKDAPESKKARKPLDVLFASERFYTFVRIMDNEEVPDIRIWSFSETVKDGLMDLATEMAQNDISPIGPPLEDLRKKTPTFRITRNKKSGDEMYDTIGVGTIKEGFSPILTSAFKTNQEGKDMYSNSPVLDDIFIHHEEDKINQLVDNYARKIKSEERSDS